MKETDLKGKRDSGDTVKTLKEKDRGNRKLTETTIIDDVFADMVEKVKPKFEEQYKVCIDRLWKESPEIYNCLNNAINLEKARDAVYFYLEKAERKIFDIENDLPILEKATVRECIRVFKSIIGPINEHRTGESALKYLWKLAQGKHEELKEKISIGFLLEFINLFRGVSGNSKIYLDDKDDNKGTPDFLELEGREAADARTRILDEIGSTMQKYLKKYPNGLDADVISRRKDNKARILQYYGGSESDWCDYTWQIKNVIRDAKPLLKLIELTEEQKDAIKRTSKNRIPFGITPYYLSLMDQHLSIGYDHAIRAQVIPPLDYVKMMIENKEDRDCKFDFMGEHDTSPIDLITRRYPGVAILKPFNTCAQICVYCQRNWEIDEVLDSKALASNEVIQKALSWFDEHQSIGDVLITGGDPIIMPDKTIGIIMEELAKKDHIYRIRIGTRTPVVLPMRWTDNLIKIISKYNEPGRRQVSLVTHFEHPYEITPEVLEAVNKICKAGMSIYNQQVFTIENSRRFETVKLRLDLKSIGVDPYYNFNMKGKEETRRFMVPIARILQERKEEARLLPGLDRTDEPIFNVPKRGKNHLRKWQDHRVVMILPNGSRVYEFHPWEKNLKLVHPYYYTDVPIYEYLEELVARGENIRDYRTIWYYY